MNIPFQQTPNYTKGDGTKKIGFVLHGTLGAFQGAVDWLMNPNRPNLSSAHYVIGRNEGQVIQLVKNEDVSWHAGNISNPSARAAKVLPKTMLGSYKNPNQSFIGIEFAWGYDIDQDGDIDAADKTLTEWQYKCALDIILNSGVPFNPDTILSHQEIASYKGDDMLFAVTEVNARIAKMNQQCQTPVASAPKVDNSAVKAEIASHLKSIGELINKLS